MTGRIYSTAAPIGGWNARDPVALMDEQDAVLLDNWFPGDSEVVTRRGYTQFIGSGMGSGQVKTLAPYSAAAVDKLIAATGGNLYEVASGTASAALATGLTNDQWQHTMFGNRLLMVNGSDAPRHYDGSTVTATTWTGSGLTISNLIGITAFKSRIYFIEKNTMNVWYGDIGAVQGTLTKFDLSTVAGSFGGIVKAIGSLSIDGGAGVDDLLVIIMSTGDTLIYQGSDPGVDFALVGVFKIGSPVGNRALVKVGGELVAITRDGFVPISRMIRSGRYDEKAVLSDKIRTAFDESLRTYASSDGWEATFFPLGNKIIVNVPKAGGHHQYVMNSNSGAWCRYSGLDAATWCLFNDEVYFGGKDGKVYKAETGLSDNGSPIVVSGQQAFSFFKNRGLLKLISAIRLTFRASSAAQASLTVNTDFNSKARSVSFKIGTGTATQWNEAAWNSFQWGGAETTKGKWKIVSGKGYSASVKVTASISGQAIAWQDTSYMYQTAGML